MLYTSIGPLSLWVRFNPGEKTMKEVLHIRKSSRTWSLPIRLFNVISRILVGGECLTLLQKWSQCIIKSQQTGLMVERFVTRIEWLLLLIMPNEFVILLLGEVRQLSKMLILKRIIMASSAGLRTHWLLPLQEGNTPCRKIGSIFGMTLKCIEEVPLSKIRGVSDNTLLPLHSGPWQIGLILSVGVPCRGQKNMFRICLKKSQPRKYVNINL